MAELLTVGSLLFWAILVLWLVVVWLLTEREYGFYGLVSTVAYLAVLQFAFKVDVLSWVFHHPSLLLVVAASYMVLGAVWAFWRWYLFCRDKLELYHQAKMEWLLTKNVGDSTVPDHLKQEWADYINKNYERRELCTIPMARQHKSRIMRWIGYFPINALSWVFNDMVRRFVKMVYEYIHDWLQGVANSVFASIKKDLPADFKLGKEGE